MSRVRSKAVLERLLGVAVLALVVPVAAGQGQAPVLEPPLPALGEPCGCPTSRDGTAGVRFYPAHDRRRGGLLSDRGWLQSRRERKSSPLDRVYTAFNYYNNEVPGMVHQEGFRKADVYRELFGIEKVFFNGDASVGLRLPLDTFQAERGTVAGGNSTDTGDLDIILKYALLNLTSSGSALSVGLVVTAPTGPTNFAGFSRFSAATTSHDTLLQPFVGYVWNLGNWYLQGFSSLVAPTDSHDTTLLFNDLGTATSLIATAPSRRP